ncbi:MAG TPA: FtsX-like permease family protein, partial [Gemmatimonadaceae bacterium]|nr:FtsX-like permease family protein [Gemmatimonadaceae bacterium]
WIAQLYRLRNIAGVAAVALGLAFAAVAVIIIGATIRMAVLARSREIAIMRLVGATDGYIRRPFLIEGFVKGILGGALALGLTWLATHVVAGYLSFQTIFFDERLALVGLAGGAMMGLVGSAFSVGRQLRRV